MVWTVIKNLFPHISQDTSPVAPGVVSVKKQPKGISNAAIARAKEKTEAHRPYHYPLKPPTMAPGVVPEGVTPAVAMDAAVYDYAMTSYNGVGYSSGGFPGFQYLSMLATRAEYQAFSNTLSSELTREWIKFSSANDNVEKIAQIEAEMTRLGVRDVFQEAAAHEVMFGRAQIFINIRGHDNKMPLILSDKTISPGSLKSLSAVEAVWTTPNSYNALDPSAPDFYTPTSWFMLGKETHSSRLMTVITRELPDILKPAYNFAGMSLYQLAEPYVDNWLRTRQSVSDLINNFSITALATAMDQVLQGNDDGSDLIKRAELFTAYRSNKGLMLLDKDREELVQVNTPLSGLHELQAQSQEHMCSVSRIPAIVLTGISPSGLNASSDGEIRIFYDWIKAQQNAHWREPLTVVVKVVQLSLFGEIDPDITFDFVPLYQMTPAEESEIRLKNSQAATAYIGAGVIDPTEERERIARDPHSGYNSIDVDDIPVPPNEPAPGESDPMEDDASPAQDKSVSEAQHKAMEAAAHGHSTLGIPEEVGKEYVSKDS